MNRPNVLWIITDQLRKHSLSCYGDVNTVTPNINSLANEGILCHNAVSNCPVCMPFRGSLFTGMLSHHNGVKVHGDLLAPDKKTIAHIYKSAGYRTSYVGKWHLASTVSNQFNGGEYWVHPLMRGGFEDWYGFDVSNSYYNTSYSHGEMADEYKLSGHQTDGLTDVSICYLNKISRQTAQPWFHVISYEAPHGGKGSGQEKYPSNPAPSEFEAHYLPEKIVLRPNIDISQEEYIRNRTCGYYAMIEHLDKNIGRLIKCLKECKMYDNTLIVFLSDHGEMLGSHGCFEKCVALEESIGIPLIFKMPFNISVKGEYKSLISGIDIYPTCAGLCGIDCLDNLDGEDLSENLINKKETDRDVLIQWIGQSRYHFGDFPYRALRTSRYCYCVGKYCDGGKGFDAVARKHTNFLYDLKEDPYEQNNLFNSIHFQDLQKVLHNKLTRKLIQYGDLPDFINYKLHY